VQDSKVNTRIQDIADEVNTIFNLNLSGIDIIYDKNTEQYKLLEINTLVWWE